MNKTHSLHEAVQIDDLEHVKAQLRENPELIFCEDWNEDTPLHLTAYFGYGDILESLSAHRAQVNSKDSHGMSPLHRATFNGHMDVAFLLLLHGAGVNAKDKFGDTALREATYYRHINLVNLQREHGGRM